jgi:hypothetical protein
MLFLLVLIVVIATSIWVFTDAKGRIDSGEHLEPIESAAGWAWGCILLWIVFFPWYLMRKSNSTVTTKPTLTRIVEQVTTPLNRDAPMPASIADEILKFGQLRDQGLISEEDFRAQRDRLLGRPAAPRGDAKGSPGDPSKHEESPTAEEARTCPSCGKNVASASDAFCRNCGGRI